jgi:hypothetical protein
MGISVYLQMEWCIIAMPSFRTYYQFSNMVVPIVNYFTTSRESEFLVLCMIANIGAYKVSSHSVLYLHMLDVYIYENGCIPVFMDTRTPLL